MTQVILLVAVIILAARLLHSILKSDTEKALVTGSAKNAGTRYPAVSIHATPTCCGPAKLLNGRRFLGEEAPSLPLPNCTNAKCRCIYVHHSDRRSGTWSRRQPPRVQSDDLLISRNEDRRESWGRRARDFADNYRPKSSVTTQSS